MRRALLALLAVGLFALAGIGAVGMVTADRAPKAARNVLVNPDGLVDAHNSPTMVRNPGNPDNVVIAHRLDRPGFSALLDWTLDGGTTWQSTPLPLPEGKDRPFAPDVAFGPNGVLYLAYVNLETSGNVPHNLWVTTSSDGGRTLAPPVHVAGRLTFQPRVAVDPSGTLHLTWLQGKEVALYRFAGGPNPVVASRSTDGGRSFSPPVQLSDPHRERVGAASPVIDSKGQLVVLYQDFKDNRRDFEFLEGPPWDKPFSLVVTRSTDGGRSFSPGVELERGVLPTRRFLVFIPEFPSLAAGPADELYVTWADGRNGDEDVFLRRSGDGGRTWSGAVRVNDNPDKDGTSQYLPRVAVAPEGRVDVLFLDRRRDRKDDVMTDATVASSHDDGGSFVNARVSSEPFSSKVGPSAAPEFGIDFGSRLGLISDDDRSLAAWTDSRLGTEDTGRQDVMSAAFSVPDPPGGLARVPVVAALVALGVVALVAAWAVGPRRQRRPTDEVVETSPQT